MQDVDIIYSKYLDDDKRTKTVGGIQTYITDLSELITEMGGKVRIVQFSQEDFRCNLSPNVCVEGFRIKGRNLAVRCQRLYDAAVRSRDRERLTIFATDTLIAPRIEGACVAIQHGVCWDIPRNGKRSLIRQVVSRAMMAHETLKRLVNVRMLVCVDYNFLNWYRTQVNKVVTDVAVIPNYTRIAPIVSKPEDVINVIFARRLCDYRGTRVFTQAIKRILDENKNVAVTVAGSGPDERWMKQQLQQYDNVTFVQYESSESLSIHADKHIAAIPTVGSEGTSLSLLEAMSAQCAVICTDVGGMTNVVLNGYNGLMVDAGDNEQLYLAIKKLIERPEERKTMAKNGYETVKSSFSYERWAEQWKKVMEEAAMQ